MKMMVYVVVDDCINVEGVRDKNFHLFRTYDDAVKKVVELFEQAVNDAGIPNSYEVDEYGQTRNVDGKLFNVNLDEDEGYAEVYDEDTFNEYISVEVKEIL